MAVRIEDVKAAGIAVDIDALAESGFASISDEDKYRLKTQGVCAQRQVGVFMIRIRVPGGTISPTTLRRVADLADRYGAPMLHITTRAGLELHHVPIEHVPALFDELAEIGLTTKGSCGDTLRNVIACSHVGTYAGEVLALEPFVRLLHDHIVATSDTTNVSRKMNVALACSPNCDEHVATMDIGFVATPSPDGGPPTFTVWGAGGLGATPRLAIELRRNLAQVDMLPAFDALVAIGARFADRTNRAKAKIKMLVDAWGVGRFRETFDDEFERAKARAGYGAVSLMETPGRRDAVPPRAHRAVPQKQRGRYTIPALVPMGELTTAAARGLADVAERIGRGIVYLTPDQNAELHDVPEARVGEALTALEALGLRTRGRGGIADVVSCVGLEYCALAVAHSMTMGEELALAFDGLTDDPRYDDFRIHVSGCPHSCAKHQVADIGLAGALTTVDGVKVEAYALYVGGNARERVLATMYPKKIERREIVRVVDALLERYERERGPNERFSQTVARLGVAAFFELIEATLAREAAA
jgi:sulfite reductase beta subunit-like hemoprotein